MSLIVQVSGGGNTQPAPQKGGQLHSAPLSSRPPPAHVTQLTSSPALGSLQATHVVQHHPQPAPHPQQVPGGLGGLVGRDQTHQGLSSVYPRALPLSPHRAPQHLAHPRPRTSHISAGRLMVNSSVTPMNHLPTPPMPHLPNSPLPLLSPSPAHQLLPTSVNSPSLIPQNIPSGFMPRLPICLPSSRGGPPQLQSLPRPSQPTAHSPQLSSLSHLQTDSNILPPHAFRKLIRPVTSHPDDDIDVGDRHHQLHPSQLQSIPLHPQLVRRPLMSPKQRERRNYFNNLALQDHNYCAVPPLPPRSPTPPPSPFQQGMGTGMMGTGMGVPPSSQQGALGSSALDAADQSFSVDIPGHPSAAPVPVAPAPVSTSTGPGCVGNYPSPHYSGPPLTAPTVSSPLSRLRQTIEDAGVGPMTPLGETSEGDRSRDSEPRDKDSRSNLGEDGGEETETAPEAEDENQDDSITRCICEYLHDDGYMICCDKCFVWQHVVCMGLDRNNIPDEYLCEKCSPRVGLDRKRAKALQRAREKEISAKLMADKREKEADSSDDDKKSVVGGGLMHKSKKVFATVARKFGKKSQEKKLEKKSLKKNYKRRGGGSGGSLKTTDASTAKPGESSPKETPIKKQSPRKNIRRKSLSATDGETEEENTDSMSLRSWIDNYEEAVTNHYSQELRARLQGAKLPVNYFKPKEVNGLRERCNVSLRGNGMKVLTANNFIPLHTPIIECRGKYMMATPMMGNKRSIPFVLMHAISPDLEVVVDGKTYGNDSRFCRRADPKSGTESNAVVKHHLEKGSLHLYIVASKNIDKMQEILLPPLDKEKTLLTNGVSSSVSIQEELQQMRRREVAGQESVRGLNGVQETSRRKTVGSNSLKRRIKRENVKKKERDADSSSDEEEVREPHRESRFPRAAQGSHGEDKRSGEDKKSVEDKRSGEDKERPLSPRKTRSAGEKVPVAVPEDKEETVQHILEKVEDIEDKSSSSNETLMPKQELKQEQNELDEEKVVVPEKKTIVSENLKILIPKEEDKDFKQESDEETPSNSLRSPNPLSPKSSEASLNLQKSPGKAAMGLPDESGLIVGVNTINYDVSIRNKAQTREEKKMEMIMKAIEAMERAEARKRSEGGESSSEKPEKKRRRSNSVKSGLRAEQAGDSNLDMSSCDEASSLPVGCNSSKKIGTGGGGPSKTRGRRQTGGSLQTRRRSRAKSGDSSAVSDNEGPDSADIVVKEDETEAQEFKFPRHKRHTGILPESCDIDDDVSRQYLRGSRSPPGIANHLLRSSNRVLRAQQSTSITEGEKMLDPPPTTPVTPVTPATPVEQSMKSIGCSAKKRWLRAAMEEDIQEEQGSGSPVMTVSPEPDYTPLKKRRLATYNEAAEEQLRADTEKEMTDTMMNLPTPVNEKLKSLPNGLKKRLISNLVLEAVLDRAMEDYGRTPVVPVVETTKTYEVEEAEDKTKFEFEDSNDNIEDKEEVPNKPEDINDKNEEITSHEEQSCYDTYVEEGAFIDKKKEAVNKLAKIEVEAEVTSIKELVKTEQSPEVDKTEDFTRDPIDADQEKINEPPKDPEVVNELKNPDQTDCNGPENAGDCDLEHADGVSVTSNITPSPTPHDSPVEEEVKPAPVTSAPPPPARDPNPPPSSAPVPEQQSLFKSFFSTDLSVEDIDRQLEAQRVQLAMETAGSPRDLGGQFHGRQDNFSERVRLESFSSCHLGSPSSEESRPGSSLSSGLVEQAKEGQGQLQPKKRVSLADYKRRKAGSAVRQDSEPSGGLTPSTPLQTSPTLPSSTSLPLPLATTKVTLPTLPDLPGLETFSRERRSSPRHHSSSSQHHHHHRSKEHRHSPARNKREKVRSSRVEPSSAPAPRTPTSPLAPPPPARVPPPPLPLPDQKREDLTERLRKEFGLNIDESDGEEGGEVPEDKEARLSGLQSRLSGQTEQTTVHSKSRDLDRGSRDFSKHRDGYESKFRDSFNDCKSRDSYDIKSRDGYEGSKSRGDCYDSSLKGRDSYSDLKSRESYESGRSRDRKGSGTPGGRVMPGLNTNQGQASRRPRTPLGSPTRRPSLDQGGGFYKDGRGDRGGGGDSRHRNTTYSAKNFYAS